MTTRQHDFGAFEPPPNPMPRATGGAGVNGGAGGGGEARAIGEAAAIGVGELSRRIAGRLADLGPLVVEGELGPPKRATSGHVYFELKEPGALVACVVWRSSVARAVPPNLAAGARVRVHGRLDLYAPRGSYSLVVERIVPCGEGELLARLERLKRELAARGWFERKRPLPALPRCVGIVTSRDGAALRDVLRTRTLRWPGFPVRLCHAPVQGPGAAEAIARAIGDLAASGGVDVIVVGRGGGSLEDLWAFNEEVVARAIFECPVPVVSAVGHETDTTLSDFVADLRAHTPTDAASAVFPDRAALCARFERVRAHLERAVHAALERRSERLLACARSSALARPQRILELRAERIGRLRARLARGLTERLGLLERRLAAARSRVRAHSPQHVLEVQLARLADLRRRADAAALRALEQGERRVAVAAATLEAISPLRVLARGYSVATREGRALVDSADVAPGDRITTLLARGRIESIVERSEGGRG